MRHSNHRGHDVIATGEDFFSWEKCIYGGSQIPVSHCLRDEDVSQVPYPFRFGKEVVEFMRNTSSYYHDHPQAIISPCEQPELFTKEELARVPTTTIRIVNYSADEVHGCVRRGVMSRDAVRIPDEQTGQRRLKGKGKAKAKAKTKVKAHFVGLMRQQANTHTSTSLLAPGFQRKRNSASAAARTSS